MHGLSTAFHDFSSVKELLIQFFTCSLPTISLNYNLFETWMVFCRSFIDSTFKK